MKILQRYILKELLLNFSFALTTITSVFFIAVSVQTLYRFQQLNFLFVLQLLPWFVPYSLAYTVPMSAMIAAVLTYGRLSADNEVTAMRTSGMHLTRILVPGVVLGLFTVVICFVLQANVIPYCQYKKRTVTRDAVARFIASLDKETSVALGQFQMSWERRDEEGRFQKMLLTFADERSGTNQKIIADSGLVYVDKGVLVFELEGIRPVIDRSSSAMARHRVPGPVSDPEDVARAATLEDPPDLEAANLVSSPDGFFNTEIAQQQGSRRASVTMPRAAMSRWGLEIDKIFPSEKSTRKLREYRLVDLVAERGKETDAQVLTQIDTEVHMRCSLSMAGLCFVLIGTPLGILFRRGNRLAAFLVSFLLIMTLYYPLMMFGEAFAETGRLPPELAVWAGNLVLGIVGGGLLLSVLKQ